MHSKNFLLIGLFCFLFLLIPLPVFASMSLTPIAALRGTLQQFSLMLSSDTDLATVGVKLLIPEGLSDIVPSVKPGWTITEVKNGTIITEIDWTGGEISSGQQDTFLFSAQLPTHIPALHWSVYQTYSDGSVISWDKNPNSLKKGDTPTFYAITHIFSPSPSVQIATRQEEEHTSQKADLAVLLSIISILSASVAVSTSRRNSLPHLQSKPKRSPKR